MKTETKNITEALLENSKSAILACVELHNKPSFPYRYEICVILAINAWELLLKAFIAQNHPEVKLIVKDGQTKPFDECIGFVASVIGKGFRVTHENINKLYEFRCHIIHFYKDDIGLILYSLLHKSVILYNEFLSQNFNIDLAEVTNLYLLPIGFKSFTSPVNFLSKQSKLSNNSTAVKTYIESIIRSTNSLNDEGIEEAIMANFNIAAFNENRIKNADIIASISQNESEAKLTIKNVFDSVKITDNESAKRVKIEEDSVFKTIYVLSYQDLIIKSRELYIDFKQGAKFNRIMKSIKGKPEYHKIRYLDIKTKTGTGKDYYTHAIFNELSNHFTLKEKEEQLI